VVAAAPAEAPALVCLGAAGGRRVHPFGELVERSARLAGALVGHGVRRGDVVATVIGSRVEWVETLLACFRIGAVALSCNEQLRAADLRHRFETTSPAVVVADVRNERELARANPSCPVLPVPDERLYAADPAPVVDVDPADPCLVTFTSGTTGPPKPAVHAQRYLLGQRRQSRFWLGVRPGDLVWCTAATGWSKSARNSFVAAWLRWGTALLHDARFEPAERMALAARERVTVLCMSPTEYRVVAARDELGALPSVRELVAAGEALDAATVDAWKTATGREVRDGYGQTETGQLTGNPPGRPVRPGSMGRPLPGVECAVVDGELVVDPRTVPTFFLGYYGEPPPQGPWRTGDRVHLDDDGYLHFEARTDDVIVSAGYRIGPFEVESVLGTHPAVAEVAVVGAPDAERGAVVHAVVVLRAGVTASAALTGELQQHVRDRTAPYKYPRRITFVDALPKTASGKVRRSELRHLR
jgi:acyl-coenzyme A synthetase/AMP-(fatty) acid ligase